MGREGRREWGNTDCGIDEAGDDLLHVYMLEHGINLLDTRVSQE